MPTSTPLSELLSMEELRGVGMDALKKRMLMQLLLQNPVAEGESDTTAHDYQGLGTSKPESKINRYGPVPGARDSGMAYQPSGSPEGMSPAQAILSPIADKENSRVSDADAHEQLRKAMADRHEAWLIDHMATQGRRAQDIGDGFYPPQPRVGPFPRSLLDLLKGK